VSSTPERRAEIGAFFAANADRLERVRRQIPNPRDEIIEDACQIAWTVLLRRPDIDLRTTGFGWLKTVAVHEALRLASATDEAPAGAFLASSDTRHEHGEIPEPADTERRGTEEKALARIEHAQRKEAIQSLKPRECEALYLKGLGYSYQEIMRLTGASYTAVNRRITEGHAALRRHLGEKSAPRRGKRRARAVDRAGGEGGEAGVDSP
jgi:DNA-directed RNA polymerase specialized sigma24 family protein